MDARRSGRQDPAGPQGIRGEVGAEKDLQAPREREARLQEPQVHRESKVKLGSKDLQAPREHKAKQVRQGRSRRSDSHSNALAQPHTQRCFGQRSRPRRSARVRETASASNPWLLSWSRASTTSDPRS